jgi:hypothetical protein
VANTLYPKGRQKFLEGGIAWLTDTIKVILVDTAAYTYSSSHEFLSNIPVGARVGTAVTLTTKTSINGVADADDVTFVALTGAELEAVVIFKDTGVEATSPLIAWFDTGVGLPLTPNSGNVPLIWDNGSSKIFLL